jgi:hypothetical protein
MQALDLERRARRLAGRRSVRSLQALWFDPMESPQLSPRQRSELFRAIMPRDRRRAAHCRDT